MDLYTRNTLRDQFERRLSASLIERGLVSAESMEEALSRQVVHGGHLPTVLWELGMVDGGSLTNVSAELLGIKPVNPNTILNAPPRVFDTVPRSLMVDEQVIPFALQGRTLCVAVSEPWDLPALEEASHRSGYAIRAYYLGEIPMERVLYQILGVPLSARFHAVQRTVKARRQAAEAKPGADQPADLMPESDFETMYQTGEHTVPNLDASELEEFDGPILELLPVDEVRDAPLAQIASLEEASELLAAATDRAQVGEVLVRFCMSKDKRVVLLVLDGNYWSGWTGAGDRIDRGKLATSMFPAEPGTMFGLVAENGAHFLGPMAEHKVHARFLEVLGGLKPKTVGLFPVHYRGRVVFGVYLDGGQDAYVNLDIADILLLAQRVPTALEQLVKRRLREGT